MAYDDGLATRVRDELGGEPGLVEKKMFGGIAFLVDGNMAVGVRGDDLMVRLSTADADGALGRPDVRPFVMGGRSSKGFVLVSPEGHGDDADLRDWVGRGVAYARTLAPK
jgi:TfoX N-terminal domain